MGADFQAFAERRVADGWEICRGKGKRGQSSPVLVLPCVGIRNKLFFSILGAWDDLTPAFPTRGLPPDLSPEGRQLAAGTVGQAGFTGHSWVLVSELQAFPWSDTTVKLFGQRKKVSYAELCDEFLTATLPVLVGLGPPDEVRMVYWVWF